MDILTRNSRLFATYMMTFLYALHCGIPMYAISSYLSGIFGTTFTSVLYLLAGISTIIISTRITKYLKHFHNFSFTRNIVVAQIFVTIGLGMTHNNFMLGLLFIVYFILSSLIFTSLNVFLESFSDHAEMGQMRGVFFTLFNLGFLVSPFLGGLIIAKAGFTSLFVISSFILIPFLFFLYRYLNKTKDPHFVSINLLQAFKKAWRNKNTRGALIAIILLECFFAMTIIYLPIYLATLGIPLTTYLTAILPIALIPLVIMPYELGIIADTKLGEKELLILGLLILALSSFAMAVVTSSNILLWIVILTMSRIGASFVETMAYTYYYKKINPEDLGLTNLFSNVRTFGLVLTSMFAIVFSPLIIMYPTIIFIMLGVILIWGVLQAIPIKDTL